MMKRIEMVGKRFGRLVVESKAPNKKDRVAWSCVCDCGKRLSVVGGSLRSGNTESCGCLHNEGASKLLKKHGLADKHPIYFVWKDVKKRCLNPNHHAYDNYGGRGITVCNEWRDDPVAFIDWCEANGWQKGLQIDRIDNDSGYRPDNCRFVTSQINNLNKRLSKSNKTGFAGVGFHKLTGKYAARIGFNGKRHHLGVFPTIEEAAAARDAFIVANKLPHKRAA